MMFEGKRMRRRDLIAGLVGVAAVWSHEARTQQAIPVIGFLGSESPAIVGRLLYSFHEGLKQAGFVAGENVVIEYRWAEGRNDQLPALAADLVRRHVRVIAAPGTTPAALAARQATTTIPIVVFMAGDPVALGLVATLSRPGGNVTGTTSLGGELAPKRLELLRELMPHAKAVALLVNPTNPALAESTERAAQAAAQGFGLELHVLKAGSEDGFDKVFAQMLALRLEGLVIAIDSFFTARREKLATLALRHAVPAIYQTRDFAEAGGVMSYGGSLSDGYRLAGLYTGRILKGEKPAELPVHQPMKAELVINLKAAQALGLSVPASLLARADEVIE
jgi:putative tryptophan/tyrosine transport system substrate-binding protein